MPPPPPPLLTGQRVTVALARESDATALLAFQRRNRDHLAPWSPPVSDAFYTLSYWRQWTGAARALYDREQAARLVIRPINEDGEQPPAVIGQVNFSNIIRGPFQAAYLGYHLDGERQGEGLMVEALRLSIGFMFAEFGLHRIMANHMPENARSARVLEKLGFEREGFARDYLFIDGAWRDHVLTALTNPDAPTPRPAEPATAARRLPVLRRLR
ncbi:GNAT family N-acetyltransferase [Inquilinus sp. CAU 1745]|uniref:GNAT family N-acetyltransferase n=1 Tax=Inquilinus sp. CAU 1745 TaxID=3140369 RepID=UPI00325B50E9